MSLRSLHRISCSIFPTICGCNSIRAPAEILCIPVTKGKMVTKKAKKVLNSTSIRSFSTGPDSGKPKEELTFKDKVVNIWKNYGKIAIGTYVGVYVTTLGSLFFALDFNVYNATTFGLDHTAAIAKVCTLLILSLLTVMF